MTACQVLSGALFAATAAIALTGRTEGIREKEQQLGKQLLIAALVVMAIGMATGM